MTVQKIYVTDYEYDSLAPEEREVISAGLVLVPRQCKTEEDIIRECADEFEGRRTLWGRGQYGRSGGGDGTRYLRFECA